MRISELLRLVIINLSQNKFKVILTSVGIIVGSATIMMVLAIGTGGKLEVAEQFKNLNAGAIDISYESNAAAFGRCVSDVWRDGRHMVCGAWTGKTVSGKAGLPVFGWKGGQVSGIDVRCFPGIDAACSGCFCAFIFAVSV